MPWALTVSIFTGINETRADVCSEKIAGFGWGLGELELKVSVKLNQENQQPSQNQKVIAHKINNKALYTYYSMNYLSKYKEHASNSNELRTGRTRTGR